MSNVDSNKMSDPMKLFNMLREQAKVSGQSSNFEQPNILKFKKGKTYALRLLWLPSNERQYPMINQYVHHIWDDEAIGSKSIDVVCPTSQYDMDNQGFKACPICAKTSELYREAEKGSSSARELYSKFKRVLHGYVPVYVVSGPTEDAHKVKILKYSVTFKKYFDSKIFGIKPTSSTDSQDGGSFDESNCIGIDAFMYFDPKKNEVQTTGYNFIVNVGSKKVPIGGKTVEMNDYKLDFTMKPTKIDEFDGTPITPKYFMSLNDEIGFDRDFYEMSSPEKLNDFKLKYLDGVESSGAGSVFNNNDSKPVVEAAPVVEKPTKNVHQEIEEEPEELETSEEEDNSASSDDEDINLDELLAGI